MGIIQGLSEIEDNCCDNSGDYVAADADADADADVPSSAVIHDALGVDVAEIPADVGDASHC